jgi:hypothetical protein
MVPASRLQASGSGVLTEPMPSGTHFQVTVEPREGKAFILSAIEPSRLKGDRCDGREGPLAALRGRFPQSGLDQAPATAHRKFRRRRI